jgi:uncharacterized protein (TIGR02145 family)
LISESFSGAILMVLFNVIYVLTALFNLELNEFYMLRGISFCLISFFLILNINAQQFGVLTDSRDGKVYKTVKIAEQIWMAENLNTEKFQNGDLIAEAKTKEAWINAGIKKKPAWCYYNYNSTNGLKYGKIYNGYAIMDPRGLAPQGYHITTLEEIKSLSDSLGGIKISGVNLKSINNWEDNGNGNNNSGWNGLPGGFIDNSFRGLGWSGTWWTSTVYDKENSWTFDLHKISNEIHFMVLHNSNGYYVRCLKNTGN